MAQVYTKRAPSGPAQGALERRAELIMGVAALVGRLPDETIERMWRSLGNDAGERQLSELLEGAYALPPGVCSALVRRLRARQGADMRLHG